MPDIKQLKLPNGNTYDLRDSRVDSIISQGTRWVGVTTTALSDGSSTSIIKIDGVDHSAEIGDIASYNNMEFIWSGTIWQEFGSTGSLKALAFKDSASGAVAVPKTYSFTGSSVNVSVSGTTTGSITPTKSAVTVSKASSGTTTYTPQGSVSAPTISVATAGSTTSVTPFGSAGSLPSCTLPTYTVANEILTITAGSFSAGSLPTPGTTVTVKTGDAAYSASSPTFTGTGARLVTDSEVMTGASFSGSSMTSTGSVTAAGSVATATTENKTVTVS